MWGPEEVTPLIVPTELFPFLTFVLLSAGPQLLGGQYNSLGQDFPRQRTHWTDLLQSLPKIKLWTMTLPFLLPSTVAFGDTHM